MCVLMSLFFGTISKLSVRSSSSPFGVYAFTQDFQQPFEGQSKRSTDLHLYSSQAFVEQELDTDEDGRVGVSDIFALLCTLQPPHRAQRASRNTAKHSSRRRATLRSDFRIGVRRPRETRRQAAVAAGMLATRNFPRGLQQKLLTAAG